MDKKEKPGGVVIPAQPTLEQSPAYVTHPANGEKFELEQLQKIVGGYIEVVLLTINPDGKKVYMIVNEEGELNGLPLNPIATAMFQECRKTDDVIVGDVLITSAID